MGKRALVAYGSRSGATGEIAAEIGAVLSRSGFDVNVRRARNVRGVEDYDLVVLGSAVYMGRWLREARRLLNRPELVGRDVWLFSSGPVGEQAQNGESEKWTKPERITRRGEHIGAHEHVVFGGSVSEQGGGFLRRNMAKSIDPAFRDLRDWDEIAAWALKIATAHAD
ncbi:flavodoxin domain-containing protein [Saccharopolyspora sp. TS4A08]|uniref:Flavodoxin domain-containing protein n=1 Tax=Saccharopolyspora ipomoeae TaxID=3042027 RepID=A0ABT6PSS3_9PSEU|nr:flavodoxin domain-containing protein [Saccharopolyspora sp. TS4A08]MDI2030476.1 flavodoxin domain-containing protein [Saccharopolyspora sp. TS4A08]